MIVSSGYNIGGPGGRGRDRPAPRRGGERRRRPARRGARQRRLRLRRAARGRRRRRRQAQGDPGLRQGRPSPRTSTRATCASSTACPATPAASSSTSGCASSWPQTPPLPTPNAERHQHEDRNRRRRPGRALLRRPDEAARPEPRDHRLGAQRRPTTPSASASSSPTRPSAASRTRTPWSPSRWPSRFARWTDIDIALQAAQQLTVGGQGFAAMSRKELLRAAAAARAPNSASTVHFRTDGARRRRAARRLRPGARRRRPELRRSAPGTPTPSGPAWTARTTSTSGSAPTWSSRRSSSSSRRRSGAPCRSTATPTPTQGSTFIVEMHEDVWRRAGFDATEHEVFPPGVSDEDAVERIARDLRRGAAGPRDADQQLQVAQLHHRPQRALARRQRRAARRRRAHRALLHRLGHQAGHGGRPGPGRLPARARRPSRPRSTAYETERRPVVESTQRAAQASLEWFENIGMYADQDPAQFCFNLLTRSRRITYENLKDCATRSSRPGWTRSSRARQGADEVAPGDVPAGPDRRAGAEEPHHRLARWTCTPPIDGRARATSTWSTSGPRPSAAPGW